VSPAATIIGRGAITLTIHDHRGARPGRWDDLDRTDWADATVVLGAGGATGLAFEAGVLLALTTDHGFEPDAVPSYVGTSAGSLAAALLTAGCSPIELAALATEHPEHVGDLVREHGIRFDHRSLPPMQWRDFVRLPTPALLWRGARLLARGRVGAALVHTLPDGRFDLRSLFEPLRILDWPDDHGRLRVCATDAADGSRVVIDGAHGIRLVDAVAASCAVPAIMRPVRHGTSVYVDGGVVSPTSADLALGRGRPSTVVVVSPMSGGSSRTWLGRVSAAGARMRLEAELRRVPRGQRVVLLEPRSLLSEAVVDDALEADRVGEIVGSSFLAAGAGTTPGSTPLGRGTAA